MQSELILINRRISGYEQHYLIQTVKAVVEGYHS